MSNYCMPNYRLFPKKQETELWPIGSFNTVHKLNLPDTQNKPNL